MSWWTCRYTDKPASNRPGARIAWTDLSQEALEMTPPRTIKVLWYAPEMFAWCARLNDIDGDVDRYIEMDVLEVADRKNNPHKYPPTHGVAAGEQTRKEAPSE